MEKFLLFAKAHFMKPNLTFEMIQEIFQKYVKNVVSVSVRITETEPKLFRFRSRPKIMVSVVHYKNSHTSILYIKMTTMASLYAYIVTDGSLRCSHFIERTSGLFDTLYEIGMSHL